MDMSQYLELYLAESREHLTRLNELIHDSNEATNEEKVNGLFRSAHSMKGMAASMGFTPIAELSHKMEDLLYRVREDEFPLDKRVSDLLLEGADLLAAMLDEVSGDRPITVESAPLMDRLAGYTPTVEIVEHPPPSVMPQSEPPKPLPVTPPVPASREAFQSVRVRTEILDRLIDTTGELFTTKHRLLDVGRETASPRLNDALNDLTRLLRELHHMVMQVRLMPFASIAERFPRVVRELAQKSGKEVSLVIDGREIELDRGILEELTDPLTHILRNAVDHGLEIPDERLAAGKERIGRIRLSAWREKDHLVISVEDDGRGMDPDLLVAAAVGKGLISAEEGERLSPREAFMLTCLPGFSTARVVTDLSGRGVGMDAVRATIQSLGGGMAIESEKGQGSRILLRLPLTIAIINVLQVAVGQMTVAFPVGTVLRTLELKRDLVLLMDQRAEFFMDEEEIPLISLNRLFGLPLPSDSPELLPIIVTEVKGRRVGVAVDRVLGQREVHVKPVGRPLNRLRGLSGGAILGDGEIIFILDPATLL